MLQSVNQSSEQSSGLLTGFSTWSLSLLSVNSTFLSGAFSPKHSFMMSPRPSNFCGSSLFRASYTSYSTYSINQIQWTFSVFQIIVFLFLTNFLQSHWATPVLWLPIPSPSSLFPHANLSPSSVLFPDVLVPSKTSPSSL